MKRIPHAPHTLIATLHGPGDLLELLPARAAQQQRFVENLAGFQVAHAYRFFFPVDVPPAQNGVLARSRRDADFDLGVGAREGGEVGFEEGAVRVIVVRLGIWCLGGLGLQVLLHSFAAAGPVAVVEVEAAAL